MDKGEKSKIQEPLQCELINVPLKNRFWRHEWSSKNRLQGLGIYFNYL